MLVYLVSKPLSAAGISIYILTLVYRRIMPKAERLSENEQLAEKCSFEGNCEIFLSRFFICQCTEEPYDVMVLSIQRG